ncbi:MAG TPA: hypothetical protein VHO84_15290 [Syntrophorhabdaceae bacterium]|nr:hypothetical protein [Syntrophorhabdaceae bacterium]
MLIQKGKTLSHSRILSFRKLVYQFYEKNGRDLPWRRTDDPYRILISEMMLQQTQVERVLGKYELFVSRFPDIPSLASAPLKEVLHVWQGLGYNRRALALIRLAQVVREKYHGKVPTSLNELISLPGIGPATAGCLSAFAFRIPVVFIETNIRRVFIHHFFKDRADISDKEIIPLVEATLDRKNPRDWYYALMDYGSGLGRTVENPNRRSSHYSRQSSFEGSDRKIRGMILKHLTNTESLQEEQICQIAGSEPQRVHRILIDLVNEGFLSKDANSFTLSGKT